MTSLGSEGRGPGGGGRDLDDIPGAVVEAITHYIKREGKLPSPNWVRRYTRETVPTGGFWPPKARRAIEEAAQRLGVALPPSEEHMAEGR